MKINCEIDKKKIQNENIRIQNRLPDKIRSARKRVLKFRRFVVWLCALNYISEFGARTVRNKN